MNADIWICVTIGSTKYLRPCNHANCESIWHTIYEEEAEKKRVVAPEYCEVGKLYDIKTILMEENDKALNGPTIEKRTIDGFNVLVLTDKNEVCITLDGPGGPVIGANNYADAEKKFLEAMPLAQSVQKLLYFKKHGKFPTK